MNIYVVNGPNLNLLGERESGLYGKFTLSDLENFLQSRADGCMLEFFQSNIEGELVSYLQKLPRNSRVILNAGAYTHTSIAIRDAILAREHKVVEVHISNVFSREEFRHKSCIADIADGVVSGLGQWSYLSALLYFHAWEHRV